jgi:hypothetical protein
MNQIFDVIVKDNYLLISGANYKRYNCIATKTANSETAALPKALQQNI